MPYSAIKVTIDVCTEGPADGAPADGLQPLSQKRIDAGITVLVEDAAYECLLTIPGIGPRTAAELATSVRIEDFPILSYSGVAPRER